ncbi:hypothetical protein D3C87_1763190 [compost metagenome]
MQRIGGLAQNPFLVGGDKAGHTRKDVIDRHQIAGADLQGLAQQRVAQNSIRRKGEWFFRCRIPLFCHQMHLSRTSPDDFSRTFRGLPPRHACFDTTQLYCL